jgi:hypothetical protein
MENLSLAPACLEVFFSPARANRASSAWWEFDVSADRLRLTCVTRENRGIRFEGRRTACRHPVSTQRDPAVGVLRVGKSERERSKPPFVS